MSRISITDFKGAFSGGTRQNRFKVTGQIPGNGDISIFHIRATQIPSLSTLPIEYNYFGRKAFYPGEKQYPTWSVAVIDDTTTNGNLWKKFSNWHNTINDHDSNNSFLVGPNSDYKAYGWKIHHLNLNGEQTDPLKGFVLNGCWPRTIMDMPFNMANPNTINQFTVVFVYDWIELDNISASNLTAPEPK